GGALFGTVAASAGDLGALLRHPALADALDAALADAGPREVDVSLPVPVPRELKVHLVPMEPALADGGRVVLLLSDRTRERAMERTRADFVANASHELRTPLASLIGFVDTLRGPARDDAEARARFLGIMAEQGERMRRLIDDLLGLSRIEITEHQPPTGRVDLAALAAAEAEAMAPILAARRITLERDLAEGTVAAPADAEQLAQVLRNLLENAARYGRDGGTIRLSVAPAAQGGAWPARAGVVLSVGDDGPGIAKEHIPRLTERFYRVDRGRSRSAGGTGLGLAIVKHIVNRHRGQLLIESEPGAGSKFHVWLPAEGG
ncbi:sensor histidine kinase, partial [Falsiroseomonas oryziterrae]|uniref:sensor histidine kinase n=1 Tax=Falsiroseomonas oryziterrae TaxID=2911368 RepID=UPI001F48A54D